MKDNKKKQQTVEQERENVEEEIEEATASAQDLEIDRDNMTDEEYISALETRLGQAIAEANECKSIAQRLQADFDNFRKRNATIYDDSKAVGQSIVIEKMLSVLDNCDLARKYLTDEAALTGFNMMETQILSALRGFGLEEIEAEGKDFDARLMNAVEREKNGEMNGKVVSVLQKGYTLNGKLLRPANVKVGYAE